MVRAWVLAIACAAACGPRASAPSAGDEPENPSAGGERPWPERAVAGYDPQREVVLATVAEHAWDGDDFGSTHFRDVMGHARPDDRFEGVHPMSTIGHETHHFLVARAASDAGTGDAFFYFERGFGAFVPDSESKLVPARTDADGGVIYRVDHHTGLADIRDFVPETARRLAARRYQTYLVEQDASAGVLHLMDEWNAYLAGGRMSIEAYRAGHYERAYPIAAIPGASTTRIDAVDGMVDFLWFVSAGIVALSEREPDYLRANHQLKAVYAVFAEETARLFAIGRTIPTFRGFHGEALFDAFATAPDNQRVRRTLVEWLGPEFTRRVFGFPKVL